MGEVDMKAALNAALNDAYKQGFSAGTKIAPRMTVGQFVITIALGGLLIFGTLGGFSWWAATHAVRCVQ